MIGLIKLSRKALGIDPKKAKLSAPAIRNFQLASTFAVNEEIPVKKRRGSIVDFGVIFSVQFSILK
ncbi:glycoside hydrolase domain-containing protein [Pedobacter cryoconitis]|uniref:glycoside hydrolase domain-containing protein n=1 Tax=Pedobacter cryoconitis TaxID=188932 RepID=UPI003B58B3BA